MIETVQALVIVTLCCYFFYLYYEHAKREESKAKYYSDNYYRNVCDSLLSLEDEIRELRQMELMIEDLNRYTSGKVIYISVPATLDGELHYTNVPIESIEEADSYTNVLSIHRDKLRSSLINQLDDIRSIGITDTNAYIKKPLPKHNVTQTVTQTESDDSDIQTSYIHHRYGIVYSDSKVSHPQGGFDVEKYLDMTMAQKKAYAKSLYSQGDYLT